jgi:hypothetical protein
MPPRGWGTRGHDKDPAAALLRGQVSAAVVKAGEGGRGRAASGPDGHTTHHVSRREHSWRTRSQGWAVVRTCVSMPGRAEATAACFLKSCSSASRMCDHIHCCPERRPTHSIFASGCQCRAGGARVGWAAPCIAAP